MKIELSLYEVDSLLYTLDKAIFYQKSRETDVSVLEHIKKMIEIQKETYKDHLLVALEKQYQEEGTLSVCALQRRENLGYSTAAQLCNEAKANVEHRSRMAQYRKEQQ